MFKWIKQKWIAIYRALSGYVVAVGKEWYDNVKIYGDDEEDDGGDDDDDDDDDM